MKPNSRKIIIIIFFFIDISIWRISRSYDLKCLNSENSRFCQIISLSDYLNKILKLVIGVILICSEVIDRNIAFILLK